MNRKPNKREIEYKRPLTEEEAAKIGTCECGSPLALVHLVEHFEKGRGVKQLLCCTRKKCDNSMETTARIHRAEIVQPEKEPEPEAKQEGLGL